VIDLPSGSARPVPSLLRGASAPVVLDHAPQPGALAHLLRHDSDPVARWDAGRRLALDELAAMVTIRAEPGAAWLDALGHSLSDAALDPALRAQLLTLPGEEEIARHLHARGHTPDPDAIHHARRHARTAIAAAQAGALEAILAETAPAGPFSTDAGAAGVRALAGCALAYHSLNDAGALAQTRFHTADNMTDTRAALSALLAVGAGAAELAQFHARWRHDRLVLDGWFSMQASHADPATGVETIRALCAHADFDWTNPNRFRAVFGAFAGNHAAFHRADGAGYGLLAEWLIKLDARNPQSAARMSTAFETWAHYDAGRQEKARAALERIKAHARLSRDMGEMVERLLEG
jgi:aminopeptidase N